MIMMAEDNQPQRSVLFVDDHNLVRIAIKTVLLEAGYAVIKSRLNLPFSMQILEDAVCNWQKSPDKFKPFRG